MVTALGDLGHIRVADAPPERVAATTGAPRPDRAEPAADAFSTAPGQQAGYARGLRAFCYGALLCWIVGMFSNYLYIDNELALELRVYVRYLLWPAILLAVGIHFAGRSSSAAPSALAPITPFFVIGVIAGALGFYPIASARDLIFWLLGSLGAAVIGAELRPRTLGLIIFWGFAVMIATSLATAAALPDIGTQDDARTALGVAWRGLFNSKNIVGPICVFALLAALLVPGPGKLARLAVIGMAGAFLILSSAQSAWLSAVALVAYILTTLFLRRVAMPAGGKALLLVLGIAFAGIAVAMSVQPLAEALGRDPTLTGRTIIWSTWLDRAAENWLLGRGPGSFTGLSMVTIDLTLSQMRYGLISTPHNMFIALLGEVGIFGLLSYLLAVGYLAFVLPFRDSDRFSLIVGAIAFSTLSLGVAETREVYSTGMNMVLTIATYAAYLAARMHRTDPGDDAGMPSAPIAIRPERGPVEAPPMIGIRSLG